MILSLQRSFLLIVVCVVLITLLDSPNLLTKSRPKTTVATSSNPFESCDAVDQDIAHAEMKKANEIKPGEMKALVTGGAGFIGSHVARACAKLGFEVVIVDDLSGGFQANVPDDNRVSFVVGDVQDADFVAALMEKEQFDVVYHLAAYAAEGLSHFIRNYNYKNNLVASTNLITQSVRVGSVKRFVFTSSIAVYGSGRTPMTEDMNPMPEDPYGISKAAVEQDLKAAREMWGLDYVIFRPHNVYGPGQNMYDKYRNVVGIFLNKLQAGQSLSVFGDGLQTRKFSFIDDVALPIALGGILQHITGEIFNVGGDIATTVNELAQVTIDAWGEPNAKIDHLDARNEVAHAESDHKKLTCFFPGLPKPVGLRDGMSRTVKWAKTVGKYFEPTVFGAVEIKKNLPSSWDRPDLKEIPKVVHTMEDNIVEQSMGNAKTTAESATTRKGSDADNNVAGKADLDPKIALSHSYHGEKTFPWHQPAANPDRKKRPTLVTVHTSHNAWAVTQLMLISLAAVKDDFDLLLIDDHSDQYDQNKLAEAWGVQVLRWGEPTDLPKGNTHTWNLAWKYAVEEGYKNIIICNNDLIIPDGTIDTLVTALEEDWDVLLPVTSERGSPYPNHRLSDHYKDVGEWTNHALHFSKVGDAFGNPRKRKPQVFNLKNGQINGYMMAINVESMIDCQFDTKTNQLFNPEKINVGNEDELGSRAVSKGKKLGILINAFVFHFKGYTLYKSQSEKTKRNAIGNERNAIGNEDYPKDMGIPV